MKKVFTPMKKIYLIKKRSSLTGFTLIDLSISIAVVFIICVGMLGIFSRGFYFLRKSKQKTAAYNLGRESMEKYSDWNSVLAVGSYTNPSPYPVTINNVVYNLGLTVSNYGGFSGDELRKIDLTISWQIDAASSNTGSLTLSTLKANY